MATIRTSINMVDNLSPIFQSINSALQLTISGFENLQDSSGNAVDVSRLQQAQRELAKVDAMFNQIENEIRESENAQGQFNNKIRDGTGAMDGLAGKVGALIGAYLSFQGLKNILGMADEIANTTARLDIMNDGLQSTAELNDKIMASANRTYSSFSDTADMVSKLGVLARDAFANNDEIIAFSELLNKHFVISGTSIQGQQAAMLQLTQAMASGALRGQELNSIFEQAPTLVQNISDHLGVSTGQIKEMAAKGQITADVVKQAMFAMADETNERFQAMPNTFADIWNVITNEISSIFGDFFAKLTSISDSERFKEVLLDIVSVLSIVAIVAEFVVDALVWGANFVIDNWSWVGPIILGVAGVLMTLLTYINLVRAAIIIKTAAIWAWNAALYANPIVWVIIAIIAIIAIIYMAVAAYNHFADKSVSATGVVAGVFLALGATIANAFIYIWNIAVEVFTEIYNISASVAEGLINIFSGDLNAIGRMFAQLGDNALSVLQSIAKAMDFVLGTNFADSWGQWRENLQAWTDDKLGENKHKIKRMVAEDWQLNTFDIVEAYGKGSEWGENLFSQKKEKGSSSIEDAINNALALGGKLDAGNDAAKKTAKNTGKMADGVKFLNDELKYLRDLAEREAINRFVTAEIKVDMTNNNNINSELDIDGIVDRFGEKVEEVAEMIAEGAVYDV